MIVGLYYLSIKTLDYYSAKKDIQQIFTEEEINNLNAEYQIKKIIDLKQQTIEMLDRIRNSIDDSNLISVSVALNELQNIDAILNNPFIVNECNPSELAPIFELRESIFQWLLETSKDTPNLLSCLHKIKQTNEINLKVYCDPVRAESYKALIEGGLAGQ